MQPKISSIDYRRADLVVRCAVGGTAARRGLRALCNSYSPAGRKVGAEPISPRLLLAAAAVLLYTLPAPGAAARTPGSQDTFNSINQSDFSQKGSPELRLQSNVPT